VLFRSNSSDRLGADFSSIFAAKPKGEAAQGAGGAAATSADGASQSLSYLAQANAGKSAEGQSQNAEADASASGSSAPPLTNDNAPSRGPAARLQVDKKIGELSKGVTGGSGGSLVSRTADAAGAAPATAIAAKSGSLSGFSKRPAARAANNARALSSNVRGAGAMRQLASVHRDNIGARTSQAAGATYDGAAKTAADIGAEAPPPIGGAGAGVGGAGAGSSGSPYVQTDRFPPVSSPAGVNVTPWQAAINTALMLVAVAGVLLFLASKIGKSPTPTEKAIAYGLVLLAALCSMAVIAFGAMIGGGKFGQPLQGGVLTAAGGFMLATCAIAVWGGENAATVFGGSADKMPILMMACGGGALAMAAWAYMATPAKYSASLFKDGRPPDWDHSYEGAQVKPVSQDILNRYLV
jgi:hypothetical protein